MDRRSNSDRGRFFACAVTASSQRGRAPRATARWTWPVASRE